VFLFGTDQRITSGPAAKRPHSKAEYMTAPERFADSQIPYHGYVRNWRKLTFRRQPIIQAPAAQPR
jgi:hypothetical protein